MDMLLYRQMLTEDRLRREHAARTLRRQSPATSYPDGRPWDQLIYQEEREMRLVINEATLAEIAMLLKRPYVAPSHVRVLKQLADELTASRLKAGYSHAGWERYWAIRSFVLADAEKPPHVCPTGRPHDEQYPTSRRPPLITGG